MSKCDSLLDLLSDGREHSQQEVLRVGGYRYTGRIMDLRKRGYGIVSIHIDGSEWRYQLVANQQGALL